MDEKIYRLFPECKYYLWGGERLKTEYGKITDKTPCAESWELSFHKDGLTKIADGRTLKEVVTPGMLGKNCERFQFFPVLIKLIDAKRNLSVQVHPSDDYALKYENSYGKTEMWYIVGADEGAGIYCGFKRDTSKEEFLDYLNKGKVEELLNFIPVKKGESYFIASGTVHAIGAGCLICEIQQNSNLTYRVYDYNRRGADGKLRELHIDKAVNVINFKKYAPVTFENEAGENGKILAKCNYFNVSELELDGEKEIFNPNSFTSVTVVEGAGEISCENINGGEINGGNKGEKFKKGDSFFIPCGVKAEIKGKASIIITDVPDAQTDCDRQVGGRCVRDK